MFTIRELNHCLQISATGPGTKSAILSKSNKVLFFFINGVADLLVQVKQVLSIWNKPWHWESSGCPLKIFELSASLSEKHFRPHSSLQTALQGDSGKRIFSPCYRLGGEPPSRPSSQSSCNGWARVPALMFSPFSLRLGPPKSPSCQHATESTQAWAGTAQSGRHPYHWLMTRGILQQAFALLWLFTCEMGQLPTWFGFKSVSNYQVAWFISEFHMCTMFLRKPFERAAFL